MIFLTGRRGIVAIVLFVLLYKYGDAVAGAMANPFYFQLGFSGVEIASVTKVFGVAATLAGIFAGGVLVARFGLIPALFVGGVLQAGTNLLFVWLAHAGNGGFSLRSKRATLAALDAMEYSRGEAEDMWSVEHVPRVGGRLAPRDVAARFSIEAADEVPYEVPFGFHAVGKYLHRQRVVELLCAVERAYE